VPQVKGGDKSSGVDQKTTGMTINGSWDGECAADLFAQWDLDEIF